MRKRSIISIMTFGIITGFLVLLIGCSGSEEKNAGSEIKQKDSKTIKTGPLSEGPIAQDAEQQIQLATGRLDKYFIKCGDYYFTKQVRDSRLSGLENVYYQYNKKAILFKYIANEKISDIDKANGMEFRGEVNYKINGACRENKNGRGWDKWRDASCATYAGNDLKKEKGEWDIQKRLLSDRGNVEEITCSDIPAEWEKNGL